MIRELWKNRVSYLLIVVGLLTLGVVSGGVVAGAASCRASQVAPIVDDTHDLLPFAELTPGAPLVPAARTWLEGVSKRLREVQSANEAQAKQITELKGAPAKEGNMTWQQGLYAILGVGAAAAGVATKVASSNANSNLEQLASGVGKAIAVIKQGGSIKDVSSVLTDHLPGSLEVNHEEVVTAASAIRSAT